MCKICKNTNLLVVQVVHVDQEIPEKLQHQIRLLIIYNLAFIEDD